MVPPPSACPLRSIAGVIKAISPIIHQADSSSFFFVSIIPTRKTDENVSLTHLVFMDTPPVATGAGRAISGQHQTKWHPFLHINLLYRFDNVKKISLQKGQYRAFIVRGQPQLVGFADEGETDFPQEEQKRTGKRARAELKAKTKHLRPTCSSVHDPLFNYQGEITGKIVTPTVCIAFGEKCEAQISSSIRFLTKSCLLCEIVSSVKNVEVRGFTYSTVEGMAASG